LPGAERDGTSGSLDYAVTVSNTTQRSWPETLS
jgi:hypothetical protein